MPDLFYNDKQKLLPNCLLMHVEGVFYMYSVQASICYNNARILQRLHEYRDRMGHIVITASFDTDDSPVYVHTGVARRP